MNVVVDFLVNRKDERCGAFYKFYLSFLFSSLKISVLFSAIGFSVIVPILRRFFFLFNDFFYFSCLFNNLKCLKLVPNISWRLAIRSGFPFNVFSLAEEKNSSIPYFLES